MHLSDRMYNCCQQRGLRGISGETMQQKMCTITQTNINVNKRFPCMGLLPVAVWEARVCASGGGLVSCVCPDFDEHCSTHRKSTHPCSPRPSEALRGKKKTAKWKSQRSKVIRLMNRHWRICHLRSCWKNKLKPPINRPYWQVLSMQPKPDSTYCSVPYSSIVIPKLL